MITLKDALNKISKCYKVGGVEEYRDFWVFDFAVDDVDCCPLAVKKETGETFPFFPPKYLGKDIGEAKFIDVSLI